MELGVASEQLIAAGGAAINAVDIGINIFAGKSALSAGPPEYGVLLRRQPGFPFILVGGNGKQAFVLFLGHRIASLIVDK
jgi:hypothetical protein